MEVEAFYDSLLVKNAFGDVTVGGYRKVLSKFLRDLGNSEPTSEQVERHIAGMRKVNYSYSHIRNSIVILERYMEFIGTPVKLGRMKRPHPIVKDILSEGEVARMLGACNGIREQVIISILAYSGIRNSEFCNLKVRDVDLDKGLIRIFDGKGSKDRLAYVSRECLKLINDYLNEYLREKDDYLITTLVEGNQYTGWDLRKRVKVISKRTGILKRVYPHLMRHSLASHLVSRNCSVITIMNLLGHTNLNTTQIYLRSFPQKVQAEYMFVVPNYI